MRSRRRQKPRISPFSLVAAPPRPYLGASNGDRTLEMSRKCSERYPSQVPPRCRTACGAGNAGGQLSLRQLKGNGYAPAIPSRRATPLEHPMRRTGLRPGLVFLALLACLAAPAAATAQLQWDANITNGGNGGSGTWTADPAVLNWFDGANNVAWNNAGTTSATFG